MAKANLDTHKLKPGDDHYKAYVGPPDQYDFMGATQFRLLSTLGLRSNHRLLDVGCGSLRAGRLILNYLDEHNYYGIEPNKWLIEDAIRNVIGEDVVKIKKPNFDHNDQFNTDVFSKKFDFIVAQSIFSHSSSDIIRSALNNFKDSLKDSGIIVATFVEGLTNYSGEGWMYPGCVSYRRSKIMEFAKKAELLILKLPWYHPRQTWYIMTKTENRLPNKKMMRHLSGAVLFEPDFIESWKSIYKYKSIVRLIHNTFSQTIFKPIKNIFHRKKLN